MIKVSGIKANKKILSSSEIGEEIRVYQSAKTADERDRARAIRNFILYAPTDDWQTWDATSAQTLMAEGRTPSYYNFLQMYVEGNAGNFMLNKVDPEFIDRSDDNRDVSEALYTLKNMYYSDKEHFDYDAPYLSSIVNGCIYRGIEEIKIARTIDEPRGRICFDSIAAPNIIFDQANMTDDIARGSREAFKRFYLFPKDMIAHFPEMTDEIKFAIMSRDQPKEYEERRSEIPETLMWGRQYEVVEHYHVEQEMKEVAYDYANAIRLPDLGCKFGSEEDWFAKSIWAKNQGFELLPENVKTLSVPTQALYLTTFVQGLGLILENRRDERQIVDGRGVAHLPFFSWSYITKNGKSTGLIDLGKDMQNDINKREQQKSKILEQTPIGDKTIIHDLAFDGDDRKYQKILDEFTDSSKPIRMSENAPPNMNLISKLNGSQLNPAIMQDESSKITMMDRILRLPPAMQGLQGKSGTSGVLFGRQVIEGNVMQKVPATTLEQYQNHKFEAWLSLAIPLYGGTTQEEKEYNYDRAFKRTDGSKVIANEFAGIDEDGQDIIINDISKLDRVDVIISKSKDNDYQKQAKRETDVALLQAMPPSNTNEGLRAIIEGELAKNVDGMSPKEKELTDQIVELSTSLAMKNLVFKNKLIDSQIQEIDQPQQPQLPDGAPAPQGGGGGNPEALNALGAANPMAASEAERGQQLPPVTTPRPQPELKNRQ
ncbi:MAG: hypothetical protein PF450_11855 [Bacteroidales bacterium]|nr:hypothetical protein [Bacteroidales bacterium]